MIQINVDFLHEFGANLRIVNVIATRLTNFHQSRAIFLLIVNSHAVQNYDASRNSNNSSMRRNFFKHNRPRADFGMIADFERA